MIFEEFWRHLLYWKLSTFPIGKNSVFWLEFWSKLELGLVQNPFRACFSNLMNRNKNNLRFINWETFTENGIMSERMVYFSKYFLPFYIFSMAMVLLIQFWDQFCTCSKHSCCGEILQKSSFNVDNPFEESHVESDKECKENETKVWIIL